MLGCLVQPKSWCTSCKGTTPLWDKRKPELAKVIEKQSLMMSREYMDEAYSAARSFKALNPNSATLYTL